VKTTEWTCVCGALNDGGRYCEVCGTEQTRTAQTPPTPLVPSDGKLPAHREFPERTWQRSSPTDLCEEPGCTKTVAQHIAEFKEAMKHIELHEVKL
jgi:hypothetical protein